MNDTESDHQTGEGDAFMEAVRTVNPIHQYKNKWWFWDEVWVDRVGPYNSEQEAREAISAYAKQL